MDTKKLVLLAAIRIRGIPDVPVKIRTTLNLLRLRRKFVCCLYENKPSTLGMLEKSKAYIAYGNINDDVLKELIEKKGRKPGNKKLSKEEVEIVYKKIKEFNFKDAYTIIKPFFRLSPPKGGFKKTTKLLYPKGTVGNVGENINSLIKRML